MTRPNPRRADGFALIDLIFVIGILSVLAIIATPRLLLARQSAGAASAIGSLRTISSAQLTFALTCGGGFYAPSLTVLGTVPAGSFESFIAPSLGAADKVTRSGYVIELASTPFAAAPPSCNGLGVGESGQAYKASADPLRPLEDLRHFAINANGQIWEHSAEMMALMPEVGDPPVGRILQ